jgi:hypothetical protein
VNYYPEQLRAILVYIETLNEADKRIDEIKSEALPYMAEIRLTDEHKTDCGTLRDEIGGAWSWEPK